MANKEAALPGCGEPTSKTYKTVIPELGRLLLGQHLPSIDGKAVTVDEFASAVEKATAQIQSKKVFLQLQILRPDYVQFLVDREAWETFCGGPNEKEHVNYRAFPAKDPRIDNPLPQYFDPGTLTPDSYGLIYRDNVHPSCPNCNCGAISSRSDYKDQKPYRDGGIRVTTPEEEFAAFRVRLEAESKRLGYKNSDERWEKECALQQAEDAENERQEVEAMKLARLESEAQARVSMTDVKKKKGNKVGKYISRCSNM
ncbi:69c89a03-5eae-41f9-83be-81a990a603dd [Sclerotinia trifoliorum]|uniref:69c89a03-5eae-41f9-83be-81a990a603dd n=1 Tax=Sclerotinia trifoliorum TaxID=28548 RepID=A0A8H2VS17_9HELO|nr:69c89a03-5eae-41f9-83be-81a990a603dd [Sclerotinia trifoliorum]